MSRKTYRFLVKEYESMIEEDVVGSGIKEVLSGSGLARKSKIKIEIIDEIEKELDLYKISVHIRTEQGKQDVLQKQISEIPEVDGVEIKD